MALRFNAAADRIAKTSGLINQNSAYTVMFWFQANAIATGAGQCLFATSAGTYNANGDELYLRSSAANLALYSVAGGATQQQNGTTTIVAGLWYFVAIVRSSPTSVQMYLNEAVEGAANTLDVSARTAATRQEFGGWASTNNEPFDGLIDNFIIYTAALTPQEIQAQMYRRSPVRVADLYGWYPCYPGEWGREYSSNGNHFDPSGTLTDEDSAPCGDDFSRLIIPFANPSITVVGAGAQVVTLTTGATLSPALPTGWQAGDFLLLALAGRPNGSTITNTVSGTWQKITNGSVFREVSTGANDLYLELWYKIAQVGETAPTVTPDSDFLTSSTTGGISAQIVAYRNVDTTNPFDVAAVNNNAAAAATWTPPAVTTITNGALIVSAVATSDDNALNFNTANGFTLNASGASYDTTTGSDHAVGVGSKVQAAAGAVTMPIWNESLVSTDPWVGATIALRWAYVPTTNLTIEDALHGHTADNLAIEVQVVVNLALTDATHSQTADALALTQVHSLAPTDATHGQASDPLALTQAHALALTDTAHSQASDPLALTQAHALALTDVAHAQTADSLALTQTHDLSIQNASHDQAVDPLALTQTHALATTDASHDQAADALALTQIHNLTTQNAAHDQTAEALALSQGHSLGTTDAAHEHTTGTLALSQVHGLTTGDATHEQAADNLIVDFEETLSVSDALHGHTADNLALSQIHSLPIQAATHGQTAGVPTLTQAHGLALTDAAHAQTAFALALTQAHSLALTDTAHSQAAESQALTQGHALSIQDTAHSQAADNLALDFTQTLSVQDAGHEQTTEALALTQAHTLTPTNAAHSQTANTLALTQAHNLTVQVATHSQAADPLTLNTGELTLSVQRATHQHAAGSPALTQAHNLTTPNAVHGQAADDLFLIALVVVVVQLALQPRATQFGLRTRNLELALDERAGQLGLRVRNTGFVLNLNERTDQLTLKTRG